MLLAIDIGNSRTKCGVFDGPELVERWTFPSADISSRDLLPTLLRRAEFSVDRAIASSVFAGSETQLREALVDVRLEFVTPRSPFGFSRLDYSPPDSLGSDRLVAAFAAAERYGVPCIVCDLGTAATIDCVDAARAFRGGIIMPGIMTAERGLRSAAPRLPDVSIQKPSSVIGTSTDHCISSGIYYGTIGAIEGLLTRMVAELGQAPVIVATGGDALPLVENCPLVGVIDEDLIIYGLRLLADRGPTVNTS